MRRRGERGNTNKWIHRLRRGAYDHAKANEYRANNRNPASTEEIGQRTDKGADGSEGEQIREDEPDPAIWAANVAVDDWRNAACQNS